jgi:membrane-bound lytic murein transglycosylase D
MATLHIVSNLEKYELDSITVDPPLEYEVITVSKQVHLKDVAKNVGLSKQLLTDLNPELRYKILPPDRYPLRIPPDIGDLLIAKLPEIPVTTPPRRAYVYHRVRFGETLSTIARRYRTSVRSIARANNIRRSNFIVAGKRLKIPLSGKYVARAKTTRKKKYRQASTHVVKSGDSLWIIANRYGTTTQRIQELNNLKSTDLHIGQVLKISGDKKETPVISGSKVYQVKLGDSPYQIALLHNMSLERFLRINQLTPRSKIYPGQKLYVE